ncbi:MAG TPA: HAMP domain-containing sensor histidine kinase [Phycisphaerae bacterium]|nr:HAMP domain-containing sensor histidine kinase [Phycisphaerae bacterium]
MHVVEARQELEAERSARVRAEKTIQMKDELLMFVSHELRTPLSAVVGWSQLMKRDRSSETLAEGLEVIERSARAQLQIVEQLLDAGQMMTGKLRLELRPVQLASVIYAAINTLRPAAIAKEVRLEAIFGPSFEPMHADAGRLEQVFRNLISNAIKFTPPGGQIRILLHETADAAKVTVIDTGLGIAPMYIDRIFDRFWQADDGAARRDGLGLGLWIVRQIVELHGGTVRAHSDGIGAGSQFVVTLPKPL